MSPSAITMEVTASLERNSAEKPVVYVMDTLHPAAIARAKELFDVVLPGTSEHAQWRHAEYLLIRSSYLTEDDIAQCPNLLAVGKQGVGTDRIDASACAKRGIKVLNTPGVNSQAVAELVLALTAALARQIRPICLRVAAGESVRKEACNGLLLHKSTIGILGMGHIGESVARMFRGAFGSSIIAYDPYMSEDAWKDVQHKRVKNLEGVLRASDIVTIHVPLTAETQGMISYRELSMMKSSAILINAARGGIVVEDDLCKALDDGLIWGVGLDCHVQEPPTKDKYERLWEHPNVISLPHIGAATAQTQMETAIAAVEKLYEYATLASTQNASKIGQAP